MSRTIPTAERETATLQDSTRVVASRQRWTFNLWVALALLVGVPAFVGIILVIGFFILMVISYGQSDSETMLAVAFFLGFILYYLAIGVGSWLAASYLPRLATLTWLCIQFGCVLAAATFISAIVFSEYFINLTDNQMLLGVFLPPISIGIMAFILDIALLVKHKRGRRYRLTLPRFVLY